MSEEYPWTVASVSISFPKYRTPYRIYVNASIETLKQYAVENPMVVIFCFYTNIEDVPDFSGISDFKWAERIVEPLYLGNFSDPNKAMEQVLKNIMEDKDEWVSV